MMQTVLKTGQHYQAAFFLVRVNTRLSPYWHAFLPKPHAKSISFKQNIYEDDHRVGKLLHYCNYAGRFVGPQIGIT